MFSGEENKFPLLTLAMQLIIKRRPLTPHNVPPILRFLTLKCTHVNVQCMRTLFSLKKTVHAVNMGRPTASKIKYA